MIRSLFSFFLGFVFISFTSSQNYTISGYIKDGSNGETLLGSNVYVKNDKNKNTASNHYGFYSISLPAGEYTLVYTYLGFQDYEKKVLLNADQKINVDLISGVLLKEVIVEANTSLDQVENTSMGRIELSTETIKKMPALLGEVDVLKALQLLPGVSAADEGSAGFYVRGGGADQNLLLLDEAPVYNSGHMLGFFSIFNSDAIKNTTLIKGNMPANYGGRISSVIDIQMKEGNDKKFSAEGGIGLIASRFTLQGPIEDEKTSFIVSGRRTYVLDLAQPFINKTNFAGTNYYFYDLNAKVNHRFSDRDRLYVSGYFGRDILNYNSADRGFNLNMPYGNTTLTARWNHVMNSKLFMNTSAIYNGYNFKLSGDQDLFSFRLNNGVKDYQAKFDFDYYPRPGRTIRFGASVIHHQFTPNVIQGKSGEVTFTNDYKPKYGVESAIYYQDEIKISPVVTLNLGLRLSRFDQVGPYTLNDITYRSLQPIKTFLAPEPRLFTTFLLNPSTSLKAGFSLNEQYAHLVSNSASTLPTDVWVPSSTLVNPQRGLQWSTGWFKSLNEGMYNISVEGFYKILKNQIDYRESYTSNQSLEIEKAFVFGKGAAYGGELFLQKSKGRTTGWIGYTYTKSWRSFGDIENGRKFPASFEKPHDLEIVWNFEASKKWELGAVFVYSTGRPFTPLRSVYYIDQELVTRYAPRNSARYQDYHRLDISANYTPHPNSLRKVKSTWSFAIYNVYNRRNPFFINYDFKSDLASGTAKATAYKVSLFPIIPSITWNFKWN
jgi:hypothetical protein